MIPSNAPRFVAYVELLRYARSVCDNATPEEQDYLVSPIQRQIRSTYASTMAVVERAASQLRTLGSGQDASVSAPSFFAKR